VGSGINWNQKTVRHALIFLLMLAILWVGLRQAPGEVGSAEINTLPLSPGTPAAAPDFIIGPRAGSLAPDFTLETLSGEAISLSDLRGQAVLINFWATWCPPCRQEMPAIQRVYERYRDQGFTEVAEFVEELGLTFPILLDREGEVFERYRVRGLPTSFFMDRAGVVHNVKIGGPMSEDFIEGQVTELLAGAEGEPDATP
jgi:thiol-disulfide isomerase/thioredoxin